MTSARRAARLLARRIGVDLVPYPQSDALWRVARLLQRNAVDLVLDVGANNGGYARGIRSHGYGRRLVSFEPLSDPFSELRSRASQDPTWEINQCAIGPYSGTIEINVAGNHAASSSVLPMLDRHLESAPNSAYVGIESVAIRTLDDIIPTLDIDTSARIFLKIDVQGYEHAVLDGAPNLLASGQVCGLQMELSFVPLYDGAMTWRQGFDRAEALGFELMGVEPGFSDGDGQMLQADAIFLRP